MHWQFFTTRDFLLFFAVFFVVLALSFSLGYFSAQELSRAPIVLEVCSK